MSTCVQVTAPHLCAGVVLNDALVVIDAAPILGWTRGKYFPSLTDYFSQKRWSWKEIMPNQPTEPEYPRVFDTVGAAAQWLLRNIDNGVDCPCCGQHVQRYKRRLRANHAGFLVRLVRRSWNAETRLWDWIEYTECHTKGHGRDYNYLKHHQLAETKPNTRGFWRPTALGVDFVLTNARIPAWVQVYNNVAYERAEDETVSIREVFRSGGFDFDALMSGEGS